MNAVSLAVATSMPSQLVTSAEVIHEQLGVKVTVPVATASRQVVASVGIDELVFHDDVIIKEQVALIRNANEFVRLGRDDSVCPVKAVCSCHNYRVLG
jgi:hypothetical protein